MHGIFKLYIRRGVAQVWRQSEHDKDVSSASWNIFLVFNEHAELVDFAEQWSRLQEQTPEVSLQESDLLLVVYVHNDDEDHAAAYPATRVKMSIGKLKRSTKRRGLFKTS